MNSDGMDNGETAKFVRKGSVVLSIPNGSGLEVVDDDRGDYPKLNQRAVELKRVRSVVDIALPWLVWSVFAISLLVGASSAAIILELKRAAPISLSGWRLQVSALAMLPFFLFEWSRAPKFERSKAVSISTLGLYFASSFALSCHFSLYIWSLGHTSLVHSLFLSCMSPIFVAIYTKLTGGEMLIGEVTGVALGLVGVGVLAAGTEVEGDDQTTYLGDFAAILGAACMAAYLIIGKKLREWMPLFVYQFPIAVLTMTILGIVGLLLEGWNDSDVGDVSGPFAWLTRRDYFLGAVLLGIGPGFIGHVGYSFVLKYSSPLVMPTGMSLQPIIGSLLAWALGEAATPGLCSCMGGAVTLAGTLFVSCASASRKAQMENKEDEYQQPATDDEEGQQGTKPLLEN